MSRKTALSLAEEVRELRQVVVGLTDQIQVLRVALDEMVDVLGWAAQNDKLALRCPLAPLASMPLDPLSPDWELNCLTPADLPAPSPPPRRETLFD